MCELSLSRTDVCGVFEQMGESEWTRWTNEYFGLISTSIRCHLSAVEKGFLRSLVMLAT